MKKSRRNKIKEGRGKVSAAISSTRREEEIANGIEAFAKSREEDDLFLV